MSAAPTFTPGPWTLMAGTLTNVLSLGGLRVARGDFDGDFDSAEAHANTRLIAAAPELYSELAKAGDRIETCIALMGRTWPDVAEKMSLQLADIRAALAKVSA